MTHRLEKYCKKKDYKGALEEFKNNYQEFSNFVFTSNVPYRMEGSRGLEEIMTHAMKNQKEREKIDPYAIDIVKKEIERKNPNPHIIYKTLHWLSGLHMFDAAEMKKDKFLKEKVTISKKILNDFERLNSKFSDPRDLENIEHAFAHAAYTLYNSEEFEYLDKLELPSFKVGIFQELTRIKLNEKDS